MADTLFDYLHWRGDLPFDLVPPGPVDFLILSQLVHAPLEKLGEGASREECTLRTLTPVLYPEEPGKEERELFRKRYQLWQEAVRGERFGSLRLLSYGSVFNPEENRQFAAGLFTGEGRLMVAYRGTDATLAGWHEDFNLAYESPIPAQRDGLAFLEAAARNEGPLFLCGHSKGGNLARYAAVCSSREIRKRITAVYSFDGPGLGERVLSSPAMEEMVERIHSFVPESSVIGQLLGCREEMTVVASDSVSVLQHNPFYWHLKGPGFEILPRTSLSSRITGETMDRFLKSCTPQTRRRLVDVIFDILEASGAVRTRDIAKGLLLHGDEVVRVIRSIPEENRDAVTRGLLLLSVALGDALGGNLAEMLQALMKNKPNNDQSLPKTSE